MSTTAEAQRTALPVVAGKTKFGRDIDYELFMDCVHCGLCLSSCPTYVETGNENDSPRGRIYLWRAVADGRAELSDEVRRHLDLCLECRACESACPSGVQYGQIIGSYKRDVARLGAVFPTLNRMQRWMLFHLTPYARRMRGASPAASGAKSGARWRGAAHGAIPAALAATHTGDRAAIGATLWTVAGSFTGGRPTAGACGPIPRLRRRCFLSQTTLATARVLQGNGCEVWVPRMQACCGTLHYHAGLSTSAQEFAATNCAAFGEQLAQVDAIINNAGGCGPLLKEYGHLLEKTPSADVASAFAAKVRDISEFLVELGPIAPQHPLKIKAVYHDACGLSHAQKIRRPPRQLLEMIPGLELAPLPESEHCCGAAGSYNLTQPEMSEQLGRRKAGNILDTGARAVFTGNVGCLLQIARYLREQRSDFWVAHPVDALWASYSGDASLLPELGPSP